LDTVLEVQGVTAGYRGTPVLRDITFSVDRGQVFGLVGPNGAGKSTLLDIVCGELRPSAGRVLLLGQDVTRLSVRRRARLGLGRTFQRLEPFGSLSVADNLLVAAESAHATQPAATVRALLRRFGLVDFADHPVTMAPTGIARLVEIARALAAGAVVLLLDEPSSGMSEPQVQEFAETVRALRADDGLSILLVEHDAWLVDAVCDSVHELSAVRSEPGRLRTRPAPPVPQTPQTPQTPPVSGPQPTLGPPPLQPTAGRPRP
jgi:branched-chain amino acid transport system ATP-binding protein